jgi:hypothetical protein
LNSQADFSVSVSNEPISYALCPEFYKLAAGPY